MKQNHHGQWLLLRKVGWEKQVAAVVSSKLHIHHLDFLERCIGCVVRATVSQHQRNVWVHFFRSTVSHVKRHCQRSIAEKPRDAVDERRCRGWGRRNGLGPALIPRLPVKVVQQVAWSKVASALSVVEPVLKNREGKRRESVETTTLGKETKKKK